MASRKKPRPAVPARRQQDDTRGEPPEKYGLVSAAQASQMGQNGKRVASWLKGGLTTQSAVQEPPAGNPKPKKTAQVKQAQVTQDLARELEDCRSRLAERDRQVAEMEGRLSFLTSQGVGESVTLEELAKSLEAENERLARELNKAHQARTNRHDLVAPILGAVFPDVEFIAGSLETLMEEVPEKFRHGVLKHVKALETGEDLTPRNSIRLADGYVEIAFSIGRGRAGGRLYAGKRRGKGFKVFITVKRDGKGQDRDIEVLRSHSLR